MTQGGGRDNVSAEFLIGNGLLAGCFLVLLSLGYPSAAAVNGSPSSDPLLLHYILVEKVSVREATTKHPELAAIAKKLFPPDDEHLMDLRSLQHFRELNDQNVARVWASLDIPVLALIREFDIRTLPLDQEYIAAIVNARHPGKGTWQLLPKMDHGFALHESLKESVAHEFVGSFGEQVVQETVKWIQVQ